MAMTGSVLRAYKTGWQQGVRQAARLRDIREGCSDDAALCMMNEFKRMKYKKRRKYEKKLPKSQGNSAWQALGRMER